MSLAKKCDVCGRLYEQYETPIDKLGCCNGIYFVNIGFDDWDARKRFDCCPKCFDSIRNHMEELKKENDNA